MTERTKPEFTSRRYLVDSRFQLKYTLLVVVLSSLVFAVLGYKLYQLNLANTEILQIQAADVAEMVKGYDRGMLYILAGFFVLQVASLFVLGILITHRIAGPMFRVNRILEEMLQTGHIHSLNKVRSRDEFKGFFGTLGEVFDLLVSKHENAIESLNRLEKSLPADVSADVLNELENLKKQFHSTD